MVTRPNVVFRCAVDICGPSDLRTLLAGLPPWSDSLVGMWHRRIDDPTADADLLRRRLPLSRRGHPLPTAGRPG